MITTILRSTIRRHSATPTATTVAATSLALVLSACGGGGGSGSVGGTGGSGNTIESFGLLKPAQSDAEMADTLRRGLAGASQFGDAESVTALPATPDAGLEAGVSAEGNFSTTNLQEAGVDESDRVKYDGEILYVLNYNFDFSGGSGGEEDIAGLSFASGPFDASISLLRTDTDTPATEEAGRIEFESDSGNGSIYLVDGTAGKQVINIDNNLSYSWGLFALDYFWLDGNTQVRSWNVDDPANPSPAWELEFDGSLLTSRIVDNVLYLVTRYTPHVEGVVPYPSTSEEEESNQTLLANATIADLLPNVVRDGGQPQELLTGTDCYVPNDEYETLTAPPASGSLITVTAIDLQAPDSMNSICFNGFTSGFYVSRSSLYITSNTGDQRTLIHKVSLGDGNPQYRGSGDVPGYLGTRNPAFLMSESGDDLRVVSSTWENFGFPVPEPVLVTDSADAEPESEDSSLDLGRHRLTVLRENPALNSLEQVAQLPNAERPAHIGKPGEDLFAARFLGDRAYLVTFERIDPLYVVDLSNADDPVITGELELPGFSTLLQPLGESLLLGVGQEVTLEQGFPRIQGVKVALFDVGDITNPVELASEEIGKQGSYSPALDDHRAITLLQTGGNYRVALPVTRYDEEPQPGQTWYEWSDSGLHQFEVDPGAGSLLNRGSLVSEARSEEQPWPLESLYNSRSVIHEDAVFFVVGERVLAEGWGED